MSAGLHGRSLGQGECESRASTRLAFSPYPATVRGDDALGNAQPQAAAPVVAGSGSVAAIELLKDVRYLLRGYALTSVRHGHKHLGAAVLRLDADGSVAWGVS